VPHNNSNSSQISKFNWPTVIAGAFLGLMLSYAAFSGDYLGRVNLLYLLVVFFLIPTLGLLVSLISLTGRVGINLASILKKFSFFVDDSSSLMRRIGQLKITKQWLFMQSQVAALAYSVTSLVIFIGMLLATDVNFIWRSTILSADQIYSFLSIIASPWFFWESAQPTLELLKLTQDSRISTNQTSVEVYARWWQFIFAIQLFYALIPRAICLWFSRISLRKATNLDIESRLNVKDIHKKASPGSAKHQEIVCEKIDESVLVTNWANIDLALLSDSSNLNLAQDNIMKAGPTATDAEQMIAERWQGGQVVLVKSWEPPLGELEDYLDNSHGYLLPLDWKEGKLVAPSKVHIDEWIRFAAQLKKWKVYLPSELNAKDSSQLDGVSDD